MFALGLRCRQKGGNVTLAVFFELAGLGRKIAPARVFEIYFRAGGVPRTALRSHMLSLTAIACDSNHQIGY